MKRPKLDEIAKSLFSRFAVIPRKPESSLFIELQNTWTSVFTGVTTFHEPIKIIPENKPGAPTVLGVDIFLRAKKDGYTLFYGGATPFVYVPYPIPK